MGHPRLKSIEYDDGWLGVFIHQAEEGEITMKENVFELLLNWMELNKWNEMNWIEWNWIDLDNNGKI